MSTNEVKAALTNFELAGMDMISKVGNLVLIGDCELSHEQTILLVSRLKETFGKETGGRLYKKLYGVIEDYSITLTDTANAVGESMVPWELQELASRVCQRINTLMDVWTDERRTLRQNVFENDLSSLHRAVDEVKSQAKRVLGQRATARQPVWRRMLRSISHYADSLYIAGIIVFEGIRFWESPQNLYDGLIMIVVVICVAATRSRSVRDNINMLIMKVVSTLTVNLLNILTFGFLGPIKSLYYRVISTKIVGYFLRVLYYVVSFYFFSWIYSIYQSVCFMITKVSGKGIGAFAIDVVNKLGVMTVEKIQQYIEFILNVVGLSFGSVMTSSFQSVTVSIESINEIMNTLQGRLAELSTTFGGLLQQWLTSIMSVFGNFGASTQAPAMAIGNIATNTGKLLDVAKNATLPVLEGGAEGSLTTWTELPINDISYAVGVVKSIMTEVTLPDGSVVNNFDVGAIASFMIPQQPMTTMLKKGVDATMEVVADVESKIDPNELGKFYQEALERLQSTENNTEFVQTIYSFVFKETFVLGDNERFYYHMCEYVLIELLFVLVVFLLSGVS